VLSRINTTLRYSNFTGGLFTFPAITQYKIAKDIKKAASEFSSQLSSMQNLKKSMGGKTG
jgi:hypothetical protein